MALGVGHIGEYDGEETEGGWLLGVAVALCLG